MATDYEARYTLFVLEFWHEVGGDVSYVKYRAPNSELEQDSNRYGMVLDTMVKNLDREVQEIQALE